MKVKGFHHKIFSEHQLMLCLWKKHGQWNVPVIHVHHFRHCVDDEKMMKFRHDGSGQ